MTAAITAPNLYVKTDSLIPQQQTRTALKLLRSADCYLQKFLKFSETGVFHSCAEYTHALLLESDPRVTCFTPQPFNLWVGNRRYIPDCYCVRGGIRHVVEIKPRGEFNEQRAYALTEFFKFHGMEFSVISNESILEKSVLAKNWAQIIQTLLSGIDEDTSAAEYDVFDQVSENGSLELGEVVSIGDRIGERQKEIALFRLAHSGKVSLDLSSAPINQNTEVTLCS